MCVTSVIPVLASAASADLDEEKRRNVISAKLLALKQEEERAGGESRESSAWAGIRSLVPNSITASALWFLIYF